MLSRDNEDEKKYMDKNINTYIYYEMREGKTQIIYIYNYNDGAFLWRYIKNIYIYTHTLII